MNGRTRVTLEPHVLVVTGVVALGAVMTVLDITIVGVAIPTLARQFGASLSSVQWLSTAYLLALAATVPLTGWASDRFGGKRVWMLSLVLFLAGSALCGAAWSVTSLIVFRVVQGVGAGLMLPTGQALLAHIAGRERVGRVLALFGIPLLFGGGVLAPLIGGVLVDDLSWRWVFFVNLPIGAIALPLSAWLLTRTPTNTGQRVDLLGLALLIPGVPLLVYGLTTLVSTNSFSASNVQVGVLVGAALLILFIWHELRTEHPLLDLRLFTNGTFTAANLVNILAGAATTGTAFLLPLFFQVLHGTTALNAGFLTVPQGLGAAVAMPIAGRLVDRGRVGVISLAGAGLVAIGYLPFVLHSATASGWLLGGGLFVSGLGAGCTISPAMSAAFRSLRQADLPRAASTMNVLQRVGDLLATAIFAVVLQYWVTAQIDSTHGGMAVMQLPRGPHSPVSGTLAAAFGNTFWWPVIGGVLVALPALRLLSSKGSLAAVDDAPAEALVEARESAA